MHLKTLACKLDQRSAQLKQEALGSVGGDRGVPIFHYGLRQLSGLLEDQNQNLLGAILPAYCGRQDLGPLAAVETF